MKRVLAQIFDKYGAEETAKTADRMKGLAFRFATVAAVSTGKDDYVHFSETENLIADGDKNLTLNIKDHKAFWSASRMLVIQVH